MRPSVTFRAGGARLWAAHLARRFAVAGTLGAGAVALQLQLTGLPVEESRRAAVALAARTLVLSLIVVTATCAIRRVVDRPTGLPRSGVHLRSTLSWIVLLAGALIMVAATFDTPWRLSSNLLGYAVVGAPLVWLVARRAGDVAAVDAALAFCTFVLFPTVLDTPRPPAALEFEPASAYRWSVGLPSPDSRIAHEVRLERPLSDAPIELLVWLARPQTGSARLAAWLNGRPLGTLREEDNDTRVLAVPLELSAGQSVLRFELAATTVDPTLRLLAHPWPGGSTAGREASSYFDGQRWLPGTFNDLIRRPQAGIYVMIVRGVWR